MPRKRRSQAVRTRVPRRASLARALAIACARTADEKQAERSLVLNITGLTSVADYLVITTASSPPHLKAVSEAVEETVRRNGGKLHHREGDYNSKWLLLDCYDLIVHIFDGPTRRYYDLERLWADAKRVPWYSRSTRLRKK